MLVVLVAAAGALPACRAGSQSSQLSQGSEAQPDRSLISEAAAQPRALEPGASAEPQAADKGAVSPGHWPASFGFGRAPTDAEVAAWDMDVMPDGTGLPAGSAKPTDGAALFATHCARCYGERGEGGPYGAVAGESGRTVRTWWPYAPPLFDYIRRTMPFERPGSLSNEQVYAATAFVLYLNDLVPEDAVIDAAALAAIEMPSRDRFRSDDRLEHDRIH